MDDCVLSGSRLTDCVIVVYDSNDGDRGTCITDVQFWRRDAVLSDGADGLRDFRTNLPRRSRFRKRRIWNCLRGQSHPRRTSRCHQTHSQEFCHHVESRKFFFFYFDSSPPCLSGAITNKLNDVKNDSMEKPTLCLPGYDNNRNLSFPLFNTNR